jgi:hypothetical protein
MPWSPLFVDVDHEVAEFALRSGGTAVRIGRSTAFVIKERELL